MIKVIFILWLLYCVSAFSFNETSSTIWDVLVKDKRFTSLIRDIEANDLSSTYKDLNAETVFASTYDDTGSRIIRRNVSKEQLLYHIANVSMKTDELWNGRVLKTHAMINELPQRLKVLLTGSDFYISTGVDQVKISDPNVVASNGMIHVTDSLLALPDYLDETLHRVARDFYHACRKASVLFDLKLAKKATLFVAKGDMFGDAFEPYEKRYLEDHPEGRSDLRRFINHQITPDIFFSDDFAEGQSTIETIEGERLEIDVVNQRGAPSEITVNGVRVIESDIIASNGVIHILEAPLMPKNKQDFLHMTPRKSLIGLNCTRFVKSIDDFNLSRYLNKDQNITLLAPPNESFDNLDKVRASWLKYHVIRGYYTPEDFIDGSLLRTESHDALGHDENQHLYVHVSENVNGKSIQFGQSNVLGDPVTVGKNFIIYTIQQALELPHSPIAEISLDLDLSAFRSCIQASQVGHHLESEGITVFAPSNDGFKRLGLLAKYLLQPDSKQDLGQVILYHAVHGVHYAQFMKEGEQRQATLQGDDISLNKTGDAIYVRGDGAVDGNDRLVLARVSRADTLISNGVLHTIDRVQIPPTLRVNNRALLNVGNTNNLLQFIQHTDLAEQILEGLDPNNSYTVLAPHDIAFNQLDDLSGLLKDKERLADFVKLHIIPGDIPRLDPDVPFVGGDYRTLLDTTVQIYKSDEGGYSVHVQGSSQKPARVIQHGRNTARGGVIMIDRILEPEQKIVSGSRLSWLIIFFIVLGGLVASISVLILGFVGWRWFKGHREGYIRLSTDNTNE